MPQVAAMCTPHTAARGCNIQCRCSDAPILECSNVNARTISCICSEQGHAAQGLGSRKTKVDLSLDLRAGHLRNLPPPGLLALRHVSGDVMKLSDLGIDADRLSWWEHEREMTPVVSVLSLVGAQTRHSFPMLCRYNLILVFRKQRISVFHNR